MTIGTIPDLSEPYLDDSSPLGEALLEIAKREATRKMAIEYNAALLGITPSPEDIQSMDEAFEALIESFGGEEDFLAILWEERGIKNLELHKQISMSGLLPVIVFREMYGEGGELFPTEQVLIKAEEQGYMMAKHILIRFSPI